MDRAQLTKVLQTGIIVAVFLCVACARTDDDSAAESPPFLTRAANPLPNRALLTLKDMTWMEVRDAIAAGATSVVIPTGGIERNGPYLSLDKHDILVGSLAEQIAREMGDMLVAPVVSFVPQGSIDPPGGHMHFAGTLSVREDTFTALVQDIAASLVTHGFRRIVLIGDSFGNQQPLAHLAADLSERWASRGVQVLFIAEFYSYEELRALLHTRGLVESAPEFHEDLVFTASLAALKPEAVRLSERADPLVLNDVRISHADLIALGRELNSRRVHQSVLALKEKL